MQPPFERQKEDAVLEYKFDTQLLIEGTGLDEDEIDAYIASHFAGDCLLAVGDEGLIKIHFHTNEPWKVLEYCAGLAKSTILSSRIWLVRPTAFSG
mgnify:CR=1 FL=1